MTDPTSPLGAAIFDRAAPVLAPPAADPVPPRSNVHAFPTAAARPSALARTSRQDSAGPGDDDAGGPFDPGGPAPPSDGGASRETLAECAKLEQNDRDNGRRLILHFGEDILHVREVGWHVWSGKVWAREGGDEFVNKLAQRTAGLIHAEVPLLERLPHEAEAIRAAEGLREKPPKDRTDAEAKAIEAADEAIGALKGRRRSLHKHATTSGNNGRVTAMIAQALPHKSVGPGDLDADHMLFNCQNGTLRFSKVEDTSERLGDHVPNYTLRVDFLDHDRAHYITKIAPVTYDEAATAPKFLAFMDKFQPNKNIRKFLQVYTALSLTGMTGQQCFVYLHGTGANGKSTYMEAMARLFGGYGDLLNSESLTGSGQRRGDQATPDFAELPGARYLRVSELPRGEPLKEALVKALTGGEEIKARHLNKGFFKFTPCFKATMSGNDLPSIGGVDNGIWRRVRLVPWSVMIPEEERRPMDDVLAEFAAEHSGILNWLIEGLKLYMQEGLKAPSEVTEATAEYRAEMDPIQAFTDACLRKKEGHDESARDVFMAFRNYCNANSIKPWQETSFGKAMPLKGFVKEMGRVRKYKNVELHDVPAPIDPLAPVPGTVHG